MNKATFNNAGHKDRWEQALRKVKGVNEDNGLVGSDYATSLYILTAEAELYERLEEHIHARWIDFDEMLHMGLSSGESILVALAGNLYNGGFFHERCHTPLDIATRLDEDGMTLALRAIAMRKRETCIC